VSADFPGHHPDDLSGGIPGDLLGDITASDPGLDALLGMLTAGPTPDELTGETAALAMFRANRHPVTPVPGLHEPSLGGAGLGGAGVGGSGTREFEPFALGPDASEPSVPVVPGPGAPTIPGPRMPGAPVPEPPAPGRPTVPGPRIPGPRSSSRRGRRAGLMAAAITLAAAGFVVAAYTEALPRPLQQAAYHALGFAGVPAAGYSTPSVAAAPAPGSARGHGSSHKPAHSQQPGAPASPKPGASGPAPASGQPGLSITAASGRIVAGGNDTFVGHLTGPSGAVAGASLSLLERAAGQRAWSLAGTATTSSSGSAVMSVSDLTTNAQFRLNGPDGALSGPVLVIVLPPVSAGVGNSGGHGVSVTASSPLAVPGDTVVLQLQFGARWLNVQKAQLNRARQAGFQVRPQGRQSVYRVVLLATASHGTSVSNTVTVSPR
jgi:collagen type IV alpha